MNLEGERYDDDQPDAGESEMFWEKYEVLVDRNRDAKWLKDLQKSQCYKAGEGRYNQEKFEEDSWQNT